MPGKLPGVALAAALLFGSAAFARADKFDVQHQRAIAANPPDLHLRISLAGGQSQFHQGELIKLQYTFTTEAVGKYATGGREWDHGGRSTLETFISDRPRDVEIPLADLWDLYDGLYCPYYSRFLSRKPLGPSAAHTDSFELTQYLRFKRPGTYRIYAISRQAILFDASKGRSEDIAGPPLASDNEVRFEVLASDPAAEARVLQDLAGKAARNWPATAVDGMRLFAMGTPEAVRAAAQFATQSDSIRQNALATLLAVRDRKARLDLLQRRVNDLVLSLHEDLLLDLALLQLLRDHPGLKLEALQKGTPSAKEWQDEVVRYLQEDLHQSMATLSERQGTARAQSIRALHRLTLHKVCSQPSPLRQDELQLRSMRVASLPDLPESEQTTDLLNFQWAKGVAPEELLPALEKAMQKMGERSTVGRLTALNAISSFDNRLAGTLLIQDVVLGGKPVNCCRFPPLKVQSSPELDAALAEVLEARRTEEMERAAPFIGLLATADVLPRVRKVYEVEGGAWPCSLQAGLLTYFLRVDEPYGTAHLASALEASYKRNDACASEPLLVRMVSVAKNPDLEPLALAELNDQRPRVAIAGGRFFSANGVDKLPRDVLVARLERLHEEWKDFDISKATAEKMTLWHSGYDELETVIAFNLILNPKTAEDLAWLQRALPLCITDQCRKMLRQRIDRFNVEHP